MTRGLLISRNTENALHKRYLTEPSANNKLAYVNYRNIYNSLIRRSRKEYYADILAKNKKKPKKTWKIYNEAINNKKSSAKIKEILKDGKITGDSKEMAEEFDKKKFLVLVKKFPNLYRKLAQNLTLT